MTDERKSETVDEPGVGMLHARLVHAPAAKMKILSIDVAAAEALGAVVLTGQQTLDLHPYHGPVVGDRPLLATSAGKLVDAAITSTVLSEAFSALDDELDPLEDQQATPAMRRHLAKVLLARCVSSLLDRPDLGAGASA